MSFVEAMKIIDRGIGLIIIGKFTFHGVTLHVHFQSSIHIYNRIYNVLFFNKSARLYFTWKSGKVSYNVGLLFLFT